MAGGGEVIKGGEGRNGSAKGAAGLQKLLFRVGRETKFR